MNVYDRLKIVVVGHMARRLGHSPEELAASPIIDIIIQLLPILLPMLLQCFAPPKALSQAQNPGPLVKWILRRQIADKVPGSDKESEAIRQALFDAFLATGKTLTAEDLSDVADA